MVERVSQFLARHPRGFDAGVAVFWTLLSFGNEELWDDQSRLGYLVPIILVVGISLYWRRAHAHTVFILQASIVILMTIIDADDSIPIAILCGAYSLGAHTADRRKSITAFVSFLVIGVASVLATDPGYLDDAAAIVLLLSIGWITGDSLRTRRAYRQSILERAERAERLRDSLAQQAVAEERTRIARDLHDVVAHSMSLMVVQAGAARRVATTDPDATVTALEAIESVGRKSLDEMRRILDVLRSDGERVDTAPQPDISSLEMLADEFRTADLPVTVSRHGEVRSLPPTLELTAYRIVQESLTNTLKHAGPAQADVILDYQSDHLGITVVDDGRGFSSDHEDHGSQRGHVGMKERVAAFGGFFKAGPRLGGGYEVSVQLPLPDEGSE